MAPKVEKAGDDRFSQGRHIFGLILLVGLSLATSPVAAVCGPILQRDGFGGDGFDMKLRRYYCSVSLKGINSKIINLDPDTYFENLYIYEKHLNFSYLTANIKNIEIHLEIQNEILNNDIFKKYNENELPSQKTKLFFDTHGNTLWKHFLLTGKTDGIEDTIRKKLNLVNYQKRAGQYEELAHFRLATYISAKQELLHRYSVLLLYQGGTIEDQFAELAELGRTAKKEAREFAQQAEHGAIGAARESRQLSVIAARNDLMLAEVDLRRLLAADGAIGAEALQQTAERTRDVAEGLAEADRPMEEAQAHMLQAVALGRAWDSTRHLSDLKAAMQAIDAALADASYRRSPFHWAVARRIQASLFRRMAVARTEAKNLPDQAAAEPFRNLGDDAVAARFDRQARAILGDLDPQLVPFLPVIHNGEEG